VDSIIGYRPDVIGPLYRLINRHMSPIAKVPLQSKCEYIEAKIGVYSACLTSTRVGGRLDIEITFLLELVK
jgi:hypothetical protein